MGRAATLFVLAVVAGLVPASPVGTVMPGRVSTVTVSSPVTADRPVTADGPVTAGGFVTAVSTAGPESETPASPGTYVLPVPPPAVVLTPFRPPEHRYGSGHRGVDLAAPVGTTIRAAGPGTVVYAGMLAGRGVISIQHAGGLRTTYEPVTASVTAGQHVAAGQTIGTLQPGHPSCAPAACLHWGARLPDRVYLDPMSLLRPWRVRLKPWSGS